MKTPSIPTSAAIRAAEKLNRNRELAQFPTHAQELEHVARLIDAETRLPELEAALRWLLTQLDDPKGRQCKIFDDTLGPDSDNETVVQYLKRVLSPDAKSK